MDFAYFVTERLGVGILVRITGKTIESPAGHGRSEIELVFSADDRGTFEQRDFAAPGEIYYGDVTTLHYRGDFEVQLGAVP